MQNPDESRARIECWNDLGDEMSTESHDKLFQTLTTRALRRMRCLWLVISDQESAGDEVGAQQRRQLLAFDARRVRGIHQ